MLCYIMSLYSLNKEEHCGGTETDYTQNFQRALQSTEDNLLTEPKTRLAYLLVTKKNYDVENTRHL